MLLKKKVVHAQHRKRCCINEYNSFLVAEKQLQCSRETFLTSPWSQFDLSVFLNLGNFSASYSYKNSFYQNKKKSVLVYKSIQINAR